jgi:hypothetical protein
MALLKNIKFSQNKVPPKINKGFDTMPKCNHVEIEVLPRGRGLAKKCKSIAKT